MQQWIIPCNIKLYDVIGAFNKLKCLDWKQSNRSISPGDEVFIYVGKPICSILFKCKVNRSNYSEAQIDDSEFILHGDTYENYGNYMELEVLEKYNVSRFHKDVLVANGLKGNIQGPRRVNELESLLNFNNDAWVKEIDNITNDCSFVGKEKEVIIKTRVNQSIYREMLLNKYKKCCLCGMGDSRMLIASHIKPWSKSSANEKVDIYNGLLLCPNHDKAFDNGLITFDSNGSIIISEQLSNKDRLLLNLNEDMKITLHKNNIEYMKYHRNNIYKR